MITKEKILEILDKYAKDNFGINSTYIDNLEFEDLAEELVKNCSIPDVVGRSEQLKAFADYAQKRMWQDGDKDLSEFVDEFESL